MAAWLRALIEWDLIPDGQVDERDIREVAPADLRGFRQCHFFAGIGGWPYALQLAGWPADAPIWTGSCPCQPYSAAGKGLGDADPRNVWPYFRHLIAECSPSVVFGEQVASKDGRKWLAGVHVDLEALGFAFGAADLPAACVGSPHRRQRLFWVADAAGLRCEGENGTGKPICGSGKDCELGDSDGPRLDREPHAEARPGRDASDGNGQLGHANGERQPQRNEPNGQEKHADSAQRRGDAGGSGFWDDWDIVECREPDGRIKVRRVERGSQPLAPRVPGRVAALHGLGNAIVPQVAAEFIRAWTGS